MPTVNGDCMGSATKIIGPLINFQMVVEFLREHVRYEDSINSS